MKDYPRAIKWISGEIEDLEETIKVRTEAKLTLYNFPAELETMKEVKEILIAAQKIQSEFYDRLEKVGTKIFQEEAKKGGL
jgi:hypothetical protein